LRHALVAVARTVSWVLCEVVPSQRQTRAIRERRRPRSGGLPAIVNKGHDVHVLHQDVQGLGPARGAVQAAENRRHVRLPYRLEDLDDGREVDFLL
jgi:hypothetical protein